MGVLGAVPFVLLLLMVTRGVVRIYAWMRRTGSPYHYAIPFGLVATAGLVHAGFEDWLFAVGSYLCVFFWFAVFIFMDLVPDLEPARSMSIFLATPNRPATGSVEVGAGSILTRNQ
jgi:hypothetical protein